MSENEQCRGPAKKKGCHPAGLTALLGALIRTAGYLVEQGIKGVPAAVLKPAHAKVVPQSKQKGTAGAKFTAIPPECACQLWGGRNRAGRLQAPNLSVFRPW